jgi:hypothetical protein
VPLSCPRCGAPSTELIARGPSASQCKRCKAVFSNARAAQTKPFSVHGDAPPSEAASAAPDELSAPAAALGILATVPARGADAPYRGVERRSDDAITLVVVWSEAFGMLGAWWLVVAMTFAICAVAQLSGHRGALPHFAPLFFVATLGALYGFAAALVNRTTIEVRGAELTVRHAPLPWWGARTIERGTIDQVFCDLVESRGRSGRILRYRVVLRTSDGDERVLVGRLIEPEQALFIEASLERALGIQDRQIVGELAEKRRAPR